MPLDPSFEDDVPSWMDEPPAYGEPVTAPAAIKATPFTWRAEADIPRRQWLYGRHLLRDFLSVDVAAGGVGKSSLKIGEALALASGRDIYGQTLHEGPLRVWLYNLEDPAEETERRLHATAKRFRIQPEDIADRLFVDSGRDQRCVIAEDNMSGVRIIRPVVDSIIDEIKARNIDVLILDPFVSSHAVSENDNMAIDMVAKEWARVAGVTGCAINLVHHVRKQNGQEATADSARGASALIGAARSVMVFNRMTKDEAEKVGVSEAEARFFFRVDNDKANLAPPGSTTWYRMNNVDLDNGDSVGVACPWKAPDAFDGITVAHVMRVQKAVGAGEWRENRQSNAWVGRAVADALMMDADDPKDTKRITILVKEWIKNGVLEVVEQEDSARRKRKFVVVGNWVTE
ncbi:plasmid and phage replicative helicase [Sphingomonas laterariae]|uniref:Plasmid and phage replicative helicase n=1 Tax=Edaphosphingomonas laterariae TaxID=861865 RepID=A0A239KDH8_9SPHN|nr:AAA family ATPase [Sphingomonas laterariae]SNT15723.1 plasmid and phage replicative helicase [Sphingomonas laterariae]